MGRPVKGYNVNGEKVPGVTTIIGRFKDSSALLYWAFEQGKAAERGEIEKLYDKRDEAAAAGTLAHNLVEAHIHNEPLPDISFHPEDLVKKAMQGYDNYIRWQADNRIEILQQEVALVSEQYQFGGCIDAIGKDSQGKLCVLDWKTSSGIYTDYLIQIAAYRQLWEENNPFQPLTGGFHLLRFSKDNADFAHHFWTELDDAWEQFILFRRSYDLDKKLKKRV
jgi:hypothetical protein